MWKLTIEDDEGQRTTLELGQGEYTVGRAEDATVRLTERNVSRKHAVIKPKPEGGWLVADAGSYNGVFVNGERIEADTPFNAGDIVQLGDYRIEIVDQQETALPAEEDPRKVRPDRLVMVIGPTPGTEFPLATDRVSIGRAEDAGVSINHASVSRLHCELVNIGQGRWECVDSGSANGIRINGVELRRGIIEPGDAIELGDVRLRYVAAGKYYRPGAADMSMQMPAVPFETMTPATTSAGAHGARRTGGTVVMVAAVVAVLILGAAYAFMRPAGGTAAPAASGTSMAQSEAEAKVLFDEAKKAAGDDIELSHRMLGRIPGDSALRETADFKGIEEKWADYMFAKAEKADDPAEKARILNKISETETVSAEKRQRAASLAAPEKARQPLDLDPQRPQTPGGGQQARTTTGGSTTTASKSSAPTAEASAAPPPTSEPGPPDKFDQNPAKAGLMAKMQSGHATLSDLQMLKAICMSDGDRACRNQAVAAIKKLPK